LEASDAMLVQQALHGNQEAFGVLVQRHRNAVYALCRHLAPTAEDAQDAAQEAFVRAYRSLRSLRDPTRFGCWLRSTASHVALDLARRHQRLLGRPSGTVGEIEAASDDPEQEFLVREEVRELQAAIANLPEQYRVPMVLRFSLQMPYEEIAEVMGISQGAVEVRLVRARKALRQMLSGAHQAAAGEVM